MQETLLLVSLGERIDEARAKELADRLTHGLSTARVTAFAALDADEFDHVFLDLQNEAGHDWNRATDDDLARLVQAVRGRAPKRLISISSYDPDADRQARRVRALKLSMLNFHDVPRGEGWGRAPRAM